MPTYKLTYFGITALGEPIRATFALAGIAFEDERLTGEQWGAKKSDPASPFFERQMPCLEITADDGSKQPLFQSKAILRYVGKIGQYEGQPLYPKDPMEAFNCDEVIDIVEDIRPLIYPSFSIQDPIEREKERATLIAPEGKMYVGLTKLNARLGKFKFAAGDAPTIADAYVVVVCYMFQQPSFLDGFPADALKPFPNIIALKDRLMSLPPLAAYYKDATESRSAFKVAPAAATGDAATEIKAASAGFVEESPAITPKNPCLCQ